VGLKIRPTHSKFWEEPSNPCLAWKHKRKTDDDYDDYDDEPKPDIWPNNIQIAKLLSVVLVHLITATHPCTF